MADEFQYDVFLSHSSKDKDIVRAVAERMRADGLRVWFDSWILKPGDSIPAKIEEGLEQSRVLVLCMSANAFGSDWAQLESGTFRFRDPLNRERRFIPLRLDAAPIKGSLAQFLYINWLPEVREQEYAKLVEACRNLTSWPMVQDEQTNTENTIKASLEKSSDHIRSILSECVFLLMTDRFPEGLWGRSLASAAGDYGHKDDPGSITVTCWSLNALMAYSQSHPSPEAAEFLTYLVSRKSERGAVGMRKYVGTEFAPAYTIIEHARHTAMAAQFFRENQVLDHALDCVKFLVQRQHINGGWVDIADSSDSKPDPLTTAYVLRSLIDFEAFGLLKQIHQVATAAFLATYRKRGMHWLHDNLKENGGWWLYEKSNNPASRAYGFTADVLNVLPELSDEDSDIRNTHHQVMQNLADTWRDLGNGLPIGIGGNKPDLDASSQFALTCWKQRHRYPDFAIEFVPSFFANLETILETSASNAAGWSTTIELTHEILPGITLRTGYLEKTRGLANNLWNCYHASGREAAMVEIAKRPTWVQRVVAESILPVTAKPM